VRRSGFETKEKGKVKGQKGRGGKAISDPGGGGKRKLRHRPNPEEKNQLVNKKTPEKLALFDKRDAKMGLEEAEGA